MVFFPKVTQGKRFKPLTAHQSETHVSSFPDEVHGAAKPSLAPSPTTLHPIPLRGWVNVHPKSLVGASPDVTPLWLVRCLQNTSQAPHSLWRCVSCQASLLLKRWMWVGTKSLFATAIWTASSLPENEYFTRAGLRFKSYHPFPENW